MSASSNKISVRRWPSQCCVPAFVDAAFTALGTSLGSRDYLASLLDVRVGPGDDNPFGLASADSVHPPGVTPSVAEQAVNDECSRLGLALRLRIVGYDYITFGMWEDVVHEALARGVIVGCGVTYQVLTEQDEAPHTDHVLRLTSLAKDVASLVDDSGESDLISWDVHPLLLERSMRAAGNGLWLFGPAEHLEFELTPPWEGK